MIQRCHGFKDLLPRDMELFRLVEREFLKSTSAWGYREVRTPTIEYLYLFTSAGTLTPGKLRRTYSFLDWDGWSGERVVLKPDATIPVARMYAECMSGQSPARLAYVTNTFMFDDSGKKTRERWQCGAELIGSGASGIDSELMSMAYEILNYLSVPNVRFRLSHSGLLAVLLRNAGFSPEEFNRIFDELLDGNESAFDRIKESRPELAEALSLMLGLNGKTAGFLKNLKALLKDSFTSGENAIDDFIAVTEMAQSLGIPCEINLAAAKGYEYYTGIIFHIMSGEEIIGGGGRYDDLVGLLGGLETPAAGFALYMDKLMKLSSVQLNQAGSGKYACIQNQCEKPEEALLVAHTLRKLGWQVRFDATSTQAEQTGVMIQVLPQHKLTVNDLAGKVQPVECSLEKLAEVIEKEYRFD